MHTNEGLTIVVNGQTNVDALWEYARRLEIKLHHLRLALEQARAEADEESHKINESLHGFDDYGFR